jgi:hypothetical protein
LRITAECCLPFKPARGKGGYAPILSSPGPGVRTISFVAREEFGSD